MKRYLTGLFIFVFLFRTYAGGDATSAPKNDSLITANYSSIKWMTLEQAQEAQKKNPKKILMNIYATWCRWCKLEDSLAFRNVEIANYINDNFYAVKFNAETKGTVTFKGKPFSFIKDENYFVNELTPYLLNGKMSYPGLVIFDESANVVSVRNGYIEPVYLELVLNYYASNSYKEMKLEEFDDEFIGKIQE
jgi:thioredoxin-related protein